MPASASGPKLPGVATDECESPVAVATSPAFVTAPNPCFGAGVSVKAVLIRFVFACGVVGCGSIEAGEVVIAKADRDFNGDGRMDHLELVMISGRKYVEEDWYSEAKYEGKFVVRVRIAGRKSVETPLEGQFWFWSKPWRIRFGDYNHDGQIDFNLGQYSNSVASAYRMFTVSPTGRVTELKLPEKEGVEIYGRDNSTSQIKLLHRGFSSWCYVRGEDTGWYRETYSWNRKRKEFDLIKNEQIDDPRR